jgi:dipeptidyl aminopeptidase
LVDLKYARNWHDYLACGLHYIIVVVDGRGTGFKGRQLRNPVKDNLGFYETIDQVNAAKYVERVIPLALIGSNGDIFPRIWAAKEYVDRKRIGIWGWVSSRHPIKEV